MRSVVWTCIAVCLILMAAATYLTREPQSTNGAESSLVIDQTELEVGSLPVGLHTVAFTLRNTGTREIRVVGREEGCRANVCFTSQQPEQFTIEGGSSYRLECELSVRGAGPFASSLVVYVDDFGLRAVPLTVRGVAVAPGVQTDAQKQ